MKYTCEIDIGLPRSRVVELFDNPANLSKWQPELKSFEPLSGAPGQPGAKAKLTYLSGKRTSEMTETITLRNLPREFAGTYDGDGFHMAVHNHFTDTGGATHLKMEVEFHFSGIMGVFAPLMRGALRRQTAKLMLNFKSFAESLPPGVMA